MGAILSYKQKVHGLYNVWVYTIHRHNYYRG